jgi:hypothetical protein
MDLCSSHSIRPSATKSLRNDRQREPRYILSAPSPSSCHMESATYELRTCILELVGTLAPLQDPPFVSSSDRTSIS